MVQNILYFASTCSWVHAPLCPEFLVPFLSTDHSPYFQGQIVFQFSNFLWQTEIIEPTLALCKFRAYLAISQCEMLWKESWEYQLFNKIKYTTCTMTVFHYLLRRILWIIWGHFGHCSGREKSRLARSMWNFKRQQIVSANVHVCVCVLMEKNDL